MAGASDSPDEDAAGSMTTTEITRTVRLKLETSHRKNERVQQGIDAYQQVATHMADVLPSYPEAEWTPHHTQMYRQATRALPDDDVAYKTTLAQQAQQKVAAAFKAWREAGKSDASPKGEFGDGSYLGLRQDDITIVENDRGWGLETRFISYEPLWFHIDSGAFQEEFLTRITDPEDPADAGAGELHLHDDGTLFCHLTVSWPVEVLKPDDVETAVGVDLNDDPLVVMATVTDGSVDAVEFVSGAEFRHHRDRLDRRRDQAQREDNLQAIRDARLNYHRYTDHITNVASRRVVDHALEHAPAVIYLEDLVHYRETAKDPLHGWPFAETQTKITAKATEEGLPVMTVDPRYTSTTCRQCGTVDEGARDGREFHCRLCGYEVHADVNAAINIAMQKRTTNE